MLCFMVVAFSTAVSFAVNASLYPLLKAHALAKPNARSSHRVPTPQGGGLAVMAAMLGTSVAFTFGFGQFGPVDSWYLLPVLAAAAALTVVGAIDDVVTAGVGLRLSFQILSVAVVIALLPADLRLMPLLPVSIERLLLGFGLLWFVNLVNFMDGLDWMTVAEMVPLTAGLALIGSFGALPPTGVLVALALLGGLLGFAPFNKPVARLFLGDAGSLPIGLVTGWLLILVAGSGHIAAAILLPLYYVTDATLTLLRRLIAGEKVWQGHRTHFYQRATDRGYTTVEVLGHVFGVNLLLVGFATVTVLASNYWLVNMTAVIGGAGVVVWLLTRFGWRK